jgi:beta-lactamase regulating signal transducer with metallopeptidase domain
MIASWMIYIVLVGATVTGAAAVVENALRATRLPARLLWVAAICFPVVVAIASARLAEPTQTPPRVLPTNELSGGLGGDQLGNSSSRFVPSLSIAVSPGSRLAMFDLPLLALWITASLLTLVVFGGAAVRLRRIRSAAELREIEGVRVSVTPSTGPLVVGILHPQILIPRWVLELDRSEQQLVLAHEQEHLRGRDPALLALSAFIVALTPWNPFLWYMLRRLGRAIELDCDQRVLAERPDMRAYTALLLSVASRSQSTLLPLAGLAASTSSLEERFRSMTTNPTRNRGYRLLSAAAVVVLLLVATAMMPRPIRGTQGDANLISGQGGARATGRVRVVSASRFSTYKVYATGGSFSDSGDPPAARVDTLNQFVGALSSAGRVFNIDLTNGDVHFVSQDTSSIHVEAAMFGGSRALWFSATGRHLVLKRGGVGVLSEDPQQGVDLADKTFFEFQVDTPAVVREAVKPKYPDALKPSGLGGEVLAQFVVDSSGYVDMDSFKVLKSTAPEFTAAVRAVLPAWKINPAIMRGAKVSQLVQQAFEFAPPPRE